VADRAVSGPTSRAVEARVHGLWDRFEHVRTVLPARSKLYPPRARSRQISRRPVIDRLRATDPDAIIVTAPAGYGKSTMLAELARVDGRPTAWLTVDELDNDPAVLLTGIAMALDAVEPVDWDRFAALVRGQLSIASPALRGFGWMLAERTMPFLLVVDDVHELTSTHAMDVLEALVEAIPDGSAIALGGRDGSRLHRGSLRRRRTIAEVGLADLAFSTSEVAELSSSLGVEVEQYELEALMNATEGWPIAVYLSLQTRDERASKIEPAVIGGNARPMAEYFSDVLLAALDRESAEFLMACSTFERVSGKMCDDVLERTGSAALLEDLERRNFLVISLDDRREWYRLHHLWAEFLATEYGRRSPGTAEKVAGRASRWYEEHGEPNAAVMAAARSGDLDRVERLVVAYFPAFGTSGRLASIDRWIGLFDHDDAMKRPLLMVVAGSAKWIAGDGASAAQWLALVDAAVTANRPEAGPGWSPPVARALLRANIGVLPAAEMAEDARYVHEHLEPGADWRPIGCVLHGTAAFMLGDDVTAERMFRESAFGAAARPLVKAYALALLAVVSIERGDWDAAIEAADEGRLTGRDLDAVPAMCLVNAVISAVAARRGDTDGALERGQLARRQLASFDGISPWFNLQTRIALARSMVMTGQQAEAQTLLQEVDAILEHVPDAVAVRDQVAELRRSSSTRQSSASHGPSSLTTAELRVLQHLPTHLSIAEIAERLFVSRNTVKSQTISIYRKLGTSSRSGAVDIARDAQLMD